jgi:hypothetical protein
MKSARENMELERKMPAKMQMQRGLLCGWAISNQPPTFTFRFRLALETETDITRF